jgi:hypothetical protein
MNRHTSHYPSMRLLAVGILIVATLGLSQDTHAQSGARGIPTVVIAVMQQPLDPSSPTVTTELRRVTGTDTPQPLYRTVTSYGDSLALSRDGRRLAFTDRQFELHLVTIATGHDQTLGKGIWAQFSPSGRYLASMAGDLMPVISPGPQGHLTLNDLTTGRRSSVGPSDPLFSDFTWSPRADRLAWQIHLLKGGANQQRPDPKGPLWMGTASAMRPGRVTIMRPPGRLGDLVRPRTTTQVRNDGSPTWSADGKSLIYWKYASKEASGDTYRWQLVAWQIPSGPARVVWTARTAFPNDMMPPPPVVSPNGSAIASLLGGPNHTLNQLTLYFPAKGTTRTLALPGEPRQVVFSPNGKQLVVVWDEPPTGSDSHIDRRAGLVDVASGKLQTLGPALQAFWCTCG